MTLANLPSAIKAFFTILSSLYIFGKIFNASFNRKIYHLMLFYSFLITPIVFYVQISFRLYTILSMTTLIVPFCYHIFRHHFPQTICITLLAIGCSYAAFAISVMITIPITLLLIILEVPNQILSIFMLSLISILQYILVFFLFRTKRFRTGIPELVNVLSGNAGVFIGALLILASSCFYLDPNLRNSTFHFLLMVFILSFGILIWLWWQKSIQADYINKNNSQQIDLLETKLQERDAELERLSKIIHKDNKLLAALELSTREVLQDASNEKAESLLLELNRFSKERSETLHAYEAGRDSLPNIGLFSVDTMLNYLCQRALKHKIDFQLNLEGELSGITSYISEDDLCTIIADLGENAIIATKDAETKNILLSIKQQDINYILSFYDSGEPFAAEVLENLGKKRCTTHAETGGSGIGLVTTAELVTKYHGEFYITDENIPQPYTKCVVVMLKERR